MKMKRRKKNCQDLKIKLNEIIFSSRDSAATSFPLLSLRIACKLDLLCGQIKCFRRDEIESKEKKIKFIFHDLIKMLNVVICRYLNYNILYNVNSFFFSPHHLSFAVMAWYQIDKRWFRWDKRSETSEIDRWKDCWVLCSRKVQWMKQSINGIWVRGRKECKRKGSFF